MTHQRQLIRRELEYRLKTTTSAGLSVTVNRSSSLFDKNAFPAIDVRTVIDKPRLFSTSPITYQRDLRLSLDIYINAEKDIDDKLDMLCESVETILMQSSLDCLADHVTKEALVQSIDIGDSKPTTLEKGGMLYSVMSIDVDCEYYQYFESPDPLDDFTTAAIVWSEKGEQAKEESAKDFINVRKRP